MSTRIRLTTKNRISIDSAQSAAKNARYARNQAQKARDGFEAGSRSFDTASNFLKSARKQEEKAKKASNSAANYASRTSAQPARNASANALKYYKETMQFVKNANAHVAKLQPVKTPAKTPVKTPAKTPVKTPAPPRGRQSSQAKTPAKTPQNPSRRGKSPSRLRPKMTVSRFPNTRAVDTSEFPEYYEHWNTSKKQVSINNALAKIIAHRPAIVKQTAAAKYQLVNKNIPLGDLALKFANILNFNLSGSLLFPVHKNIGTTRIIGDTDNFSYEEFSKLLHFTIIVHFTDPEHRLDDIELILKHVNNKDSSRFDAAELVADVKSFVRETQGNWRQDATVNSPRWQANAASHWSETDIEKRLNMTRIIKKQAINSDFFFSFDCWARADSIHDFAISDVQWFNKYNGLAEKDANKIWVGFLTDSGIKDVYKNTKLPEKKLNKDAILSLFRILNLPALGCSSQKDSIIADFCVTQKRVEKNVQNALKNEANVKNLPIRACKNTAFQKTAAEELFKKPLFYDENKDKFTVQDIRTILPFTDVLKGLDMHAYRKYSDFDEDALNFITICSVCDANGSLSILTQSKYKTRSQTVRPKNVFIPKPPDVFIGIDMSFHQLCENFVKDTNTYGSHMRKYCSNSQHTNTQLTSSFDFFMPSFLIFMDKNAISSSNNFIYKCYPRRCVVNRKSHSGLYDSLETYVKFSSSSDQFFKSVNIVQYEDQNEFHKKFNEMHHLAENSYAITSKTTEEYKTADPFTGADGWQGLGTGGSIFTLKSGQSYFIFPKNDRQWYFLDGGKASKVINLKDYLFIYECSSGIFHVLNPNTLSLGKQILFDFGIVYLHELKKRTNTKVINWQDVCQYVMMIMLDYKRSGDASQSEIIDEINKSKYKNGVDGESSDLLYAQGDYLAFVYAALFVPAITTIMRNVDGCLIINWSKYIRCTQTREILDQLDWLTIIKELGCSIAYSGMIYATAYVSDVSSHALGALASVPLIYSFAKHIILTPGGRRLIKSIREIKPIKKIKQD